MKNLFLLTLLLHSFLPQETNILCYQQKMKTHRYDVAGVYAVNNYLSLNQSNHTFTISYCQYNSRSDRKRKAPKKWIVKGTWEDDGDNLMLLIPSAKDTQTDTMIYRKTGNGLVKIPDPSFQYEALKKDAKLPVWKFKKNCRTDHF